MTDAELVNHHDTLREMLGHAAFNDTTVRLQTLKDNVRLMTPELLDEISQIIVAGGHALVKKTDEALRGRCDSFVVETDVHFPTDINLLLDAMRKIITLTPSGVTIWPSDWRQSEYNLRHVKREMRAAQNKKRSKAKSPERARENQALVIEAHQKYPMFHKATSTKPAGH